MSRPEKEGKVIESAKNCVFVKSPKCSAIISELMKELYLLKKPHGVQLKREEFRPFEDPNPLERLSSKFEAGLFVYGSTSKKRPNNLVLGRFFNNHVYDMIEIGIDNFKSFADFDNEKVNVGQRPCFMFVGEEFTLKEEYKALANVILDLYQGENVSLVNLTGIEHVIIVSASGDNVYFRTYKILFKKSGSRTPRVELEEMGPSFDIKLRRQQLPSKDVFKMANQVPPQLQAKKVKNISKDEMETRATIHMPRQDLNTLATRKMKGLSKKRKAEDGENSTQDMDTTTPTDNMNE